MIPTAHLSAPLETSVASQSLDTGLNPMPTMHFIELVMPVRNQKGRVRNIENDIEVGVNYILNFHITKRMLIMHLNL